MVGDITPERKGPAMPQYVILAEHTEAVADLVYDSGLSQWNTVEVCPTRPVADLMSDLDRFPVVFE